MSFGSIAFMASLDTVGSGALRSGAGAKGVNNPGSGAWGVGDAAVVVNGAGWSKGLPDETDASWSFATAADVTSPTDGTVAEVTVGHGAGRTGVRTPESCDAGCVSEPAGGQAGCGAATNETGPGILCASGPVVPVVGERSALGSGDRSSVACDKDGETVDAIAEEGAEGVGCAGASGLERPGEGTGSGAG